MEGGGGRRWDVVEVLSRSRSPSPMSTPPTSQFNCQCHAIQSVQQKYLKFFFNDCFTFRLILKRKRFLEGDTLCATGRHWCTTMPRRPKPTESGTRTVAWPGPSPVVPPGVGEGDWQWGQPIGKVGQLQRMAYQEKIPRKEFILESNNALLSNLKFAALKS